MQSHTLKAVEAEPQKIAVIDDDAAVRKATHRLLRSLGYAAETFERAEDFLASESVENTSCVISDIRMPGMDGLALQSCLRKAGVRLPVIFVTAFPDEDVRRSALAAGAFGFLNKPFLPESLIECIQRALRS